ncbi:aminotransferase class I/II-fold pyridoxal phosphate-dependent enzyme [Flavivirga aquimarina]|uniref:Aminotransferase class I/II-fold pyridoxal phosphate-dependent enzyme n=1 Tax=Flavivirga aquimarina TaxID=2027862 RepID=A0ABT8WD78_9FLAO|nr:aminotransferase class I/II-fold pyridoxal phosphate-dependent enzyme [Flavivirga aquimarina]MDO5971110.1 aminotransferase class I/II-fold pyridoxal phosphate-dependent enzyme [Flavivirga aquimarina]
MLTKTKIYLSSPHMGGTEQKFVADAFSTNWIAPLGPHVDGFENDLKKYLGDNKYVAALSSGTASIHLALQLLNVSKGDEVLCQSFTFSASANPIIYQGATPVFIDSESDTWNMSPELLEIAIKDRIEKYKKPKAIIAVHLYGMPYKAKEINIIAKKYEIPVIEDSAEALGSTYFGQPCATLSDIGILSFNGNKIITTSGGGALITSTQNLKEKAVFLSTQARDNAPHYEHSSIGFNYRMSNVLAGIGRGQMEVIDDRVKARRQNFDFYKKNLSQFNTIEFLQEPQGFFSNRWITCIKTDSFETREQIRLKLLKDDIESRPLWKPMHMQAIFKDCLHFTNGTSEDLFDKGLCLPSGSNLSQEDLDRVLNNILKTPSL